MNNKEDKEARLADFSGTQISRHLYNLIIGGTLIWGALINVVMAFLFGQQIREMNYLLVIILYFLGSIGCMIVVYKSPNPFISFLGFTGLSASMGLLLTCYVQYFEGSDILTAFIITAIVTVIMTALGSIFPDFFLGLGKVLFISLLITILVEIIMSFCGISLIITDYIVCLLFCGYLGYDWAKAQAYYPTVDHAVDSAADIYVDIVNLFVRILSILGKKK